MHYTGGETDDKRQATSDREECGHIMSGSIPLLPRPMSGWQQDQNCPCCRKVAVSPRLLGCLHSVCTPCMNKVRLKLLLLEGGFVYTHSKRIDCSV